MHRPPSPRYRSGGRAVNSDCGVIAASQGGFRSVRADTRGREGEGTDLEEGVL